MNPLPLPRVHLLQRLRLFGVLSLTLLFLALAGDGLLRVWPMVTFDDAYMFVRYAEHLRQGLGFAWNPDGLQTFGCTSLTYLGVVVALLSISSLPAYAVLFLGSSLFAVVGVGLLVWACRREGHSRRWLAHGRLWLPPLGALLLWSPSLSFHATSGMDTMLAFTVSAGLILVSQDAVRVPRWPWSLALVGWLAVLTRPDLLLYALLWPPLYLWARSVPQLRTLVLRYLGLLFLLLTLEWLLLTWTFGSPLPLPFYAKQAGFLEGYLGDWNSVRLLGPFLVLSIPALSLFALTGARRDARRLVPLLPVLLTIALLLPMEQIMGFEARFCLPSLPFVWVSAVSVLDAWLERREQGTAHRLGLLRWAICLLPLTLLNPQPVEMLAKTWRRLARPVSGPIQASARFTLKPGAELSPLGWWPSLLAVSELVAGLPEGSVVMASEYGLVGARSPNVYILDPLGLHDPQVARQGFSADRALSQRPSLIWMPHSDYSGIRAALLDAPRFWQDYDFYPGLFEYGVAVLRERERAGEAFAGQKSAGGQSTGEQSTGEQSAVEASMPGEREARSGLEVLFQRAYPGQKLEQFRAIRGEQ